MSKLPDAVASGLKDLNERRQHVVKSNNLNFGIGFAALMIVMWVGSSQIVGICSAAALGLLVLIYLRLDHMTHQNDCTELLQREIIAALERIKPSPPY